MSHPIPLFCTARDGRWQFYNAYPYVQIFKTNHKISSTGDVVIFSMQFQLTSERNATTPTFTLTCTSTGGPATTVSWTVNNHTVTEDSHHHITSQILTDADRATYNHTLIVTGRMVGEYKCTVSNSKPSFSSGVLAVVGENDNYTFEDTGCSCLKSVNPNGVNHNHLDNHRLAIMAVYHIHIVVLIQ